MTDEDTEKLVTATYSALKSEFGPMGDLKYELANTVANIYFRYFQQAMDSAPTITTDELLRRRTEYENIPKVIAELRLLPEKGVHESHIEYVTALVLDLYKYRIADAMTKTPIRRVIERKFRKTQDIPDLVRGLHLYK